MLTGFLPALFTHSANTAGQMCYVLTFCKNYTSKFILVSEMSTQYNEVWKYGEILFIAPNSTLLYWLKHVTVKSWLWKLEGGRFKSSMDHGMWSVDWSLKRCQLTSLPVNQGIEPETAPSVPPPPPHLHHPHVHKPCMWYLEPMCRKRELMK